MSGLSGTPRPGPVYDGRGMIDVAAVLGPGGPVAAAVGSWEDRAEQREMALAVDRVMREGGRLLVEAGTGVGKSFAYLVPAVAAAAGTR
ncbi:bifunctional ATP-dependent DNA helicase/DNA polymerase III subunit epsilon [compost metagenome]